jgi:streptogramin lyase
MTNGARFIQRPKLVRSAAIGVGGVVVAVLMMSLGVVNASADNSVTLYNPPTPLSGPCVVTPTPDGAIWFLEAFAAKIARIDPVTGNIIEYPIPWSPRSSLGPFTPIPCAMTTASDGNVYFTNGVNNQIGKLDPQTAQVTLFDAPNPSGNLNPLNDLTPGHDNAIWFTQISGGTIGRFDLTTHQFSDYPLPTAAGIPAGIFAASDGGVWFGEPVWSKIGRIDVATKQIIEYPSPTPLSGPMVIRGESEGRYVWFGQAVANKLGRIDTRTREIVDYSIPWLSVPNAPCVSSAGNIYFSQAADFGAIGEYSPQNRQFTRMTVPHAQFSVFQELICGSQNSVWAVAALPESIVARLAIN